MKFKYLILILMIFPGLPSAQLYKRVDEQGRVTYTDKPDKVTEEEFVPPSTVQDVQMPKSKATPRPKPATSPPPAENPARYTKLSIVTPGHDRVVRNAQGEVEISIELNPPLRTGHGHRLFIYLNGDLVDKTSSHQYTIKNLDRGSYELFVTVKDGNGQPLISSDKITFHLKRGAR